MASLTDEHRRLLSEALARADADIGELQARLAEGERVADALAASRAECDQLRRDLAVITSSLSWRITAPLRLAVARARALRDGR
jgi:hypothetical protein